MLSQARKKKTPAVTTEWIIQCIINQKKVPVNRTDYLFTIDE